MQARVVADRKVVISAGTVLPKAGTDADILRLTGLIRTTHDPEKRAGLHVRLAKSLTTFGDHNRARAHLAQAQELTPDTPELLRLLGLAMFREGIIGDGLKSYDKGRWQIERFAKYRRAYPFDLWRGQPLAGKSLLVWAEQGIGDQIMHARALHGLVKTGARVTVECAPRLIPLFQRAFPTVKFVTQTVPLVPALQMGNFDFQTSMFSAWRWLKDPLGTSRSIKADPKMAAKYKAAWGALDPLQPDLRNVGISWHSNAKSSGARRSIALSALKPLSAVAGPRARFHNIQYGFGADAAKSLSKEFGARLMTDAGTDPLKNLKRAAAQIAALDLVITIDNTTAHMAGALGIPTWLLLPKGGEYRWGRDPDITALYPSVRLFWARDADRWAGVVLDVADALEGWV